MTRRAVALDLTCSGEGGALVSFVWTIIGCIFYVRIFSAQELSVVMHQQVVSSTCMHGRETSCRNAPAVSCTCLGSMQVHAHHSFVIRVRVSTQGMYSNRAWTGSRSMYNGGAMKLAPPRCTLIGLFVCVRMHHGSQLAS
jgi:hypothetical protein